MKGFRLKMAGWGILIFVVGYFLGWATYRVRMGEEMRMRCWRCKSTQAIQSKPVNVSVPMQAMMDTIQQKQSILVGEVDIDGLILTESGGNPNAIADQGHSKGICQIGRAAWQDTCQYLKETKYPYDQYWNNAEINKLVAAAYINHVIPNQYFRRWGAFDSIDARIASYKWGPGRWYQCYQDHGPEWREYLPETVKRDLKKYYTFLADKQANKG